MDPDGNGVARVFEKEFFSPEKNKLITTAQGWKCDYSKTVEAKLANGHH